MLSEKMLDKHIALTLTQRRDVVITTPDGTQYRGKIGTPIKAKNFTVTIALNEPLLKERPNMDVDDNYEFVIHSRRKLIAEIIAGLDVTSADKDIPILRVSYKCADAKKSADVVNAIANVYIRDHIEERTKSADTTEQFLTEQLQDYGNRLNNSEDDIQQYRDRNNIVNITQETETDLRKIADLKKQLASVQMNLIAIDTLSGYMRRNRGNFVNIAPNFEAFTDLLSTEIVKKVKLLQAEKRDLLLLYTPENPKVAVVDKKINDLANYLEESIGNTQTNLRIKYNDLKRTIAEAEQSFEGLPGKEKQMTVLERNFGMNEQIYKFIREKRTEAQIAKAAAISFHRIISRGEVPENPVSPNSKLIVVFSGFLGLMFGVILVIVIHSLKARVDNEQNIYRNSDTPLEKSVPMLKNAKVSREFFDKWLLELEIRNKLPKGTMLCITSANDGDGKDFVADALMKAAADAGKKAVMVLMDGKMEEFANEDYETTSPLIASYRWQIPAEWDRIAAGWRAEYDLVIIRNFSLQRSNASILPMAKSNLNMMVLDTRRTAMTVIGMADELRDRLQLPGFQYVLNRAGYVPGPIARITIIIKKMRRAFSK
jgi:capsular polysaccharide biosynthesis protein